MKRDGNSVSSYYKAWDKFDVDSELEKIEKEDGWPGLDFLVRKVCFLPWTKKHYQYYT